MCLPGHDGKHIFKLDYDNRELRFCIWHDSVRGSTDPPAIESGKNYLGRQTLNVFENGLKRTKSILSEMLSFQQSKSYKETVKYNAFTGGKKYATPTICESN